MWLIYQGREQRLIKRAMEPLQAHRRGRCRPRDQRASRLARRSSKSRRLHRLQAESPSAAFEFRNIVVTEFATRRYRWPHARRLGNGRQVPDCWKAEDGTILCTARRNWLRSQKEFGDFNVRMEYKVGRRAIRASTYRVPKDGNHHGRRRASRSGLDDRPRSTRT